MFGKLPQDQVAKVNTLAAYNCEEYPGFNPGTGYRRRRK
jgi:hypothetical protein